MSNLYIHEPSTSGKVILHTTVGEIEVELWAKEAPLTCRNFIQLCLEGYYNETIFHRLVKDFIIQGGDPTGTGQGGESIFGKPFKDEFHQRLRFNRRALLGMANSGERDMNGSQFFITLGTEPARELDRKHTLFGKITGPTVFNMLRMTETEVDSNERPKTINKILKTTVVLNPFDDIIPREKEKKKKVKEAKKPKKEESKKLNLLSFGDEAEEEEALIQQWSKKMAAKGKSAHDDEGDGSLSKEVAVRREEMADYDREEEADEKDGQALSRIREKLQRKRKLEDNRKEEEEKEKGDVDYEEMIDDDRRAREKEEVERKQAEVKAVQKEYIKALRPKKEKPVEEAPEASDNMKKYESMKMKFKDKSKNIVKMKDPKREAQTDELMERFKAKLAVSNQSAILFDKEVKLPEKKKEEEEKEEEEFGMDLEAEDEADFGWITNKFVAHDEPDPNVTKAKDANTRETSEDWYSITDPRNPMNKRRRGEV